MHITKWKKSIRKGYMLSDFNNMTFWEKARLWTYHSDECLGLETGKETKTSTDFCRGSSTFKDLESQEKRPSTKERRWGVRGGPKERGLLTTKRRNDFKKRMICRRPNETTWGWSMRLRHRMLNEWVDLSLWRPVVIFIDAGFTGVVYTKACLKYVAREWEERKWWPQVDVILLRILL